MIWLSHKKYTEEHITRQRVEICTKARRETRRMIVVASAAVFAMAIMESGFLFTLLQT